MGCGTEGRARLTRCPPHPQTDPGPQRKEVRVSQAPALIHPFPEPPAPGTVIEVAPGVLWARFPLPFQLDHINVYLIEDGEGWAVLDAGISTDESRAAWEALMDGPLRGQRLTRVIVSHSHPDHIGLAGWLSRRFGASILASQTTWLTCHFESLAPDLQAGAPYREIYMRHGLSHAATDVVVTLGLGYLTMVEPLPPTFRRIVAGDTLTIGRRRIEVLSGDGHAAEQIMLYSPEDGLFFAADQVLAKISPNVGVWATDPEGDPLGLYLRSLSAIRRRIPADVLVLAGHQLPFYGLHERCEALEAHHQDRCRAILAACQDQARSVFDLVPVLFHRALDPHQTTFAFAETFAHVNYMIGRGALRWLDRGDGVMRVTPA
jgi:glyoxylase-like metal-dependent hydrolase (beta-lactamase superfamily II)